MSASPLRQIIALSIFLALSSATMDQTFVQDVRKDGTSTIEKTMDISIFANQLPGSSLQMMADFCSKTTKASCSVDTASKIITIKEAFAPGSYYSVDSEFGLPYTTETLTIERIPNDRFGQTLNMILAAANISDSGGVPALNLRSDNNQSAMVLRKLKANLTYTVKMPSAVAEAKAGSYSASIDGNNARFDLIEVLSQSQPMVVVTKETNVVAVVVIIMVIVLAALAYSFFATRPSKTRKKKAGKKP